MKGSSLAFSIMVKHFFRENPGAFFVLGFQVLLVVCAILLVFGFSSLAEAVAAVSYSFLLVGVGLQLVCFVRDSDGGEVDG